MHAQHGARKSRRRALLIALACIPAITACSPPSPGLTGYPGENAAATKAYLASLKFHQTDSIFDGAIQCHGAADCTGDSIRLNIVPESTAHQVPIDAALHGGPGYIVARIINLDDKPYGSFRLLPHDTAYLWAGAMPGGDRRLAIFAISSATGAATARSRAKKAGWCNKPPGVIRSIAAVHINSMTECNANTFYSASEAGNHVRVASASSGILSGATLSAFAHASGLWFSCSMGCCEGSGFEAVL